MPASYKGPLMSLSNRVLMSGGAVGEADVRRYVRESDAVPPHLGLADALNEVAQLNSLVAPSVGVHFVDGSNLEWRLESGALLRCWKPYEGVCNSRPSELVPAMHHEGVVGDERLVSVAFASPCSASRAPDPYQVDG